MALLDELAEKLAHDALDLAEKAGDERLVDEIAKVIGASSTTMEEAFLTAVRLYRAERRARRQLEEMARRSAAGQPAVPPVSGGDGDGG